MQAEPKETLKNLHLYNIQLEPALQTRVKMLPTKVADYQKAYSNNTEFPPLLVAMYLDPKGEPTYKLIDGWHRYQALMNLGGLTQKVKVRVLEVPRDTSIHKLRYLGGRENLKNGLALTPPDRRELFRSYIRSKSNKEGNRYKSYREIAHELSVIPHQTIARWMVKDFNAVARAMGNNPEYKSDMEPSIHSGVKLTTMPDLSSRDRDLFYIDILEVAKGSCKEERESIIEELRNLLETLETIPLNVIPLPFTDPFPDDPF